MAPIHRKILLNALKTFDLLVMILSFILTTLIIYYRIDTISFNQFLYIRIELKNFAFFFSFLITWSIIFSLLGLYHSKRLSSQWEEVEDVVKATTLGALLILLLADLFEVEMVTPFFIGVFWIITSGVNSLSRLTLRYILKHFRIRGKNLRNMLIFGTSSRAIRFARRIEAKPELGYCLIGFVDNDWTKTQEFQKEGYALVSDLNGFPNFIRNNIVDEVVICLPLKSFYLQISKIVTFCQTQGIIVRLLPDIFNLRLTGSKTEQYEDESAITLYHGSIEEWQVLTKRALDFVLSLILIITVSPLFFVTALIIKISSSGPVFFVQERLGLNKRKINIYKFRTMVPDAENKQVELEHLNEVSGPVFKIKNDPRLTPIGKFLRKTSIDELPQLINVLRGDMSLVGPRPLPVRDYNGFNQDWHRRRFSIRPGITCLWQVNGRNNIPFEKWMELDMYYIDHWSLYLDFKIIAKTIPSVIRRTGAS